MSDTKTDTAIVDTAEAKLHATPKPKRYRHTQETNSIGGFGMVGKPVVQTRVIEVLNGAKVPKNAEPVPDDTPLSDWATTEALHPNNLIHTTGVRFKE